MFILFVFILVILGTDRSINQSNTTINMKKQTYTSPELSITSVELEIGIAQSTAPAGYGEAGAAGMAGQESGSTDW